MTSNPKHYFTECVTGNGVLLWWVLILKNSVDFYHTMKLGIICGSHRQASQSSKVGRFIEKTLIGQGICNQVFSLNLADFPFPLWDESIWEGDPG